MPDLMTPAPDSIQTAFLAVKRDVTPLASPEPLTAQSYTQHMHLLFRDFTTHMADQDVLLTQDELLPGYHATATETSLFAPTALRQIHHFYANYVQSLHFLAHPTMDFYSNRKDVTQSHPHDGPSLIQELAHNLHHTQHALHIFGDKITDADARERYTAFQEKLLALTTDFCANKEQLSALPTVLVQSAPQQKPVASLHLN